MKTAFILLVAWLGFAHAIATQVSIARKQTKLDITLPAPSIDLYK